MAKRKANLFVSLIKSKSNRVNWANLNDTRNSKYSFMSKLPIMKKKMPYDNRISCRQFFTVHSK